MSPYHDSTDCAVAKTLNLLGDKWTLLVVRELMLNRSRTFKDFTEQIEGIPTNMLSDRLKRLAEQDLIERHPYQERPPRYEYRLTEKGKTLRPVLMALAEWGADHLGGALPRGYRRRNPA